MHAAMMALFLMAQAQVHVFEFKQVSSDKNLFEITTAIRSVTDISTLMADAGKRSLTIKSGDPAQMALAEWLVKTLDVAAPGVGSAEYKYSGGGDESVVRVYFLGASGDVKSLHALATKVRTVSGVRRLFAVGEQQALVVRGTAEQVAQAGEVVEGK